MYCRKKVCEQVSANIFNKNDNVGSAQNCEGLAPSVRACLVWIQEEQISQTDKLGMGLAPSTLFVSHTLVQSKPLVPS